MVYLSILGDEISYLMRRVKGKRNCLSCRKYRLETCTVIETVRSLLEFAVDIEGVGSGCGKWK